MAHLSKLLEIGLIVFSFAIGFLAFYLLTDLSKEEKKAYMSELSSQLINLVIFIWVSKIILNIPLFLQDPMAVLAYPSDSTALYLAVLLTLLLLIYQSKKKKLHIFPLIEPFVHILLTSAFIYEFIQFTIEDNPYAFGPFILFGVVSAFYYLARERIRQIPFLMMILTAWAGGMVVLSFVQPFVTLFGYMMEAWFIIIIYVLSMVGLVMQSKRRPRNEEEVV